MYANTPWSGHYDVQSTIWVTAHTTQFAQPGWRYLDSGSGFLPEKGSYVALRSSDKKNWSVVLETIDARNPQTALFRMAGGLAASEVYIWETNSTHTFERVAEVKPVNGAFTYTFDPDSLYTLTTTTGQGKGKAQPPASAAFPLPYRDDFEKVTSGHTPRYLADQDGAFEVQPCIGRKGRCLEQAITTKPIAWAATPNPYTLAGDVKWADYGVAADVRFLSAAPAVLIGRIDSADNFQDDKALWPSGYILCVKPGGAWELLSQIFGKPVVRLGSGSIKLDNGSWHHVELRFMGKQVTASLDGAKLIEVEDVTHTHGMFALGTEWNRIQFDNLRVTP
jgi:hypothetical protein